MRLDPKTIRYLADDDGNAEAAVVPIELWREISSEIETRFLLGDPATREQLMSAVAGTSGEAVPLPEAMQRLGLTEELFLRIGEVDEEEGLKILNAALDAKADR